MKTLATRIGQVVATALRVPLGDDISTIIKAVEGELKRASTRFVVIDAEDNDQVDRFTRELISAFPKTVVGIDPTDRDALKILHRVATREALRLFVNPKPEFTADMVKALRRQIAMDREKSAYWREGHPDILDAVESWASSYADWLGVD